METPPYIEFKFFKSVENISFEEVQAKRMERSYALLNRAEVLFEDTL